MNSLPIRIGIIGSQQICCNRGLGALANAMESASDVELIAIADFLPDQVRVARDVLASNNSSSSWPGSPIRLPDNRCFSGFDAYQKVLDIPEINYVIICPPAHFRPTYVHAAIEAGKHVFVEKPVATAIASESFARVATKTGNSRIDLPIPTKRSTVISSKACAVANRSTKLEPAPKAP